jgi:hypothetical protein
MSWRPVLVVGEVGVPGILCDSTFRGGKKEKKIIILPNFIGKQMK